MEATTIDPPSKIEEHNFTKRYFVEFLTQTIFSTVLACESHEDSGRQYLTAVGELMDRHYLAQIHSADRSFVDVRLIQIPARIMRGFRADGRSENDT